MGGKQGRKKGRTCRDCGGFNEPQASYCGQCGSALGESSKSRRGPSKREPSYGLIIAIIVGIVAAGLVFKMVISPRSGTFEQQETYQQSSPSGEQIDAQVQLVASNFKCACGGCGELPLVECDCDMPRGALEEKAFIREKLLEGYSVDQVIQGVEERYGLRIKG
jgi:hypothetical protein